MSNIKNRLILFTVLIVILILMISFMSFYKASILLLSVLSICGIVSAIIFAFWIINSILKPLNLISNFFKGMVEGNGNLTIKLEFKRQDEIGDLVTWVNLFVEKIEIIVKKLSNSSETLESSFEILLDASQSVLSGNEQTSVKVNNITIATEEMTSNMSSIADTMEHSSTNVNMVASATEEMAATINEIAQNSGNAQNITENAVLQVQEASKQVNELGQEVDGIGKVTEAITKISEQTNLLALNATIEAARAGEYGKGFAVVANEIKELSQQTAEATSVIKGKIEGIQNSTTNTVSKITNVWQIINEVNEIVSTIATSVEEQSAATKEIANNISQASQGVQDVSTNVAESSNVANEITMNISDVNNVTQDMLNQSLEMNITAQEVFKLSSQLKDMSRQFQIGEMKFHIGKVKSAHLAWRIHLESVLKGHKTISLEHVGNHHECEFGKWYDGSGQSLSSNSIFKQVGVYHEEVHKIIYEIVSLIEKGQNQKANTLMKNFEVVREKLFTALDDLYVS